MLKRTVIIWHSLDKTSMYTYTSAQAVDVNPSHSYREGEVCSTSSTACAFPIKLLQHAGYRADVIPV